MIFHSPISYTWPKLPLKDSKFYTKKWDILTSLSKWSSSIREAGSEFGSTPIYHKMCPISFEHPILDNSMGHSHRWLWIFSTWLKITQITCMNKTSIFENISSTKEYSKDCLFIKLWINLSFTALKKSYRLETICLPLKNYTIPKEEYRNQHK